MLAEFALEREGTFEAGGAGDFHLPAVAGLRAEDHDMPVAGAAGENVLDHGDDVALRFGAAGVVQFDGHGHGRSLRHSSAGLRALRYEL